MESHSTTSKASLQVWLALLLFASTAIILAALAFEHIGGYRPCPLCLRQRYAYYFAIPATLVGLISGRQFGAGLPRLLLGLIAVAFLANTYLGVEHAGVEWKWWPGPDTCSAALPKLSGGPLDLESRVIRCDEASWRFAGLSFAGWNAILSLGLALGAAAGALCARPIASR